MKICMRSAACAAIALACAWRADAASVVPVVDDSIAQAVTIEGNKELPAATVNAAIHIKPGSPLTRAAVLADIERIEAAYKKAGKSVQVWPDVTHPGEGQGKPVTTLTYRLIEGAKPRHYDESADPLENYYENTLVCAAAQTLNDLCHLWLNRDGSFVNFDANEAKMGHYTTSPRRADGKVQVCQYWDTPLMVTPAELSSRNPMPAPAPAPGGAGPGAGAGPAAGMAGAPPAGGGGPPAMVCKNQNDRTTCVRGVNAATLSDEDKKLTAGTMGDRFHGGMCYPIGPHDPGDIYFEKDDPLPGQLGMDRVLLIRGRQ